MKHDFQLRPQFQLFASRLVRTWPDKFDLVSTNTVALGIVRALYNLASTECRDGDIGKLSDELIETALGFTGDEGQMIDLLVTSGILAPHAPPEATQLSNPESCRLYLLGWESDAYDFIKKQWRRAKAPDSPPGRPKRPRNAPKRDSGKSHAEKDSTPSGAFEEFWAACHQRKGRGAAAKAFDKALQRGNSAAAITTAMKQFATTPDANPKDRSPILPATWLNQDRFLDDPKTWETPGGCERSGKEFNPNKPITLADF